MPYPVTDFKELEVELKTLLHAKAETATHFRHYTLEELIGEALLVDYYWWEYSGKQRQRIGHIARRIIKKRGSPFRKVKNLTNGKCVYTLRLVDVVEIP